MVQTARKTEQAITTTKPARSLAMKLIYRKQLSEKQNKITIHNPVLNILLMLYEQSINKSPSFIIPSIHNRFRIELMHTCIHAFLKYFIAYQKV